MMKKVLFVLLIIGFAAALYWSFDKFHVPEKPLTHPLRAVPTEAAIIIEASGFSSFWNHFSETNIAWHSLKTVPAFHQIDTALNQFNLELEKLSALDDRINSTPIIWAVFAQGDGQQDFLFLANLDNLTLANSWNKLLFQSGYIKISESTYEGCTILTCSKNDQEYYSSFSGELIHFSSSLSIAQSSISKSKKEEIIDAKLQMVYETGSKNQKVSILIQPNRLPNLFKSNLNKQVGEWLLTHNHIGNWTELDFSAGANSFNLFGFTAVDSADYLYGVSSMTTKFNECLEGIPNFVNSFKWWGFEDYNSFINSNCVSPNELSAIKNLGGMMDLNFESNIDIWMDGQFASFNSGDNETSVVCRSNGSMDPTAKLFDYTVSDSAMINHLGVPVYTLNSNFKAGLLFKEPTAFIYTFVIGEYVYFTPSEKTSKQVISALTAAHNLLNDVDFINFYTERFSERSNFIYYCNHPFSSTGLNKYFNSKLTETIAGSSEVFDGFNRFGWQISGNENELTYHNLSVSFNAGKDQLVATNDLWDVELDTVLIGAPQLLKNHRTNTEEVFVQDAANQIYLISSAGNLKWKQHIDGPILGEVKQIDIFGNGKYQMLFNTKNKVYLIDINGKRVNDFPVNLTAFATNELSVFDYQNDHNYRILIGTEGGNVLNYDKEGHLVEGWKFIGAEANVSSTIHHFTLANKDYICFHDEAGKIHVLDRRGAVRFKTGKNLPQKTDAHIVKGRSIGTSRYIYQDTSGALMELHFDGNQAKIYEDANASGFSYSVIDYEKDQLIDFLIQTKDGIEIKGPDLSLIKFMQIPTDGRIGYSSYNGSNLFYQLNQGALIVYDEYGDPMPDFPENSDFAPAISDMNKDGQTDIILVSGKRVKAKILK
jgi:hypothetical protein